MCIQKHIRKVVADMVNCILTNQNAELGTEVNESNKQYNNK